MKLKEWLDNPNTKNIPGYNLVKEQLKSRYKAMLQKGKKFDIGVYQSASNGLLVHVKVPTEGDIPNLHYDVVLHVAGGSLASLSETEIKVFSNCPSFTFRFAYVAFQDKQLIPEFISYYEDIVIKEPPKETNPMKILGYEKSIYYALLSLEYYGYRTYNDLNSDVKMDRTELQNIMSAEAKVQEAQVKKARYMAQKKADEQKAKTLLAKQKVISEPIKKKEISRPNHRIEAKSKITANTNRKKIGAKKKK